MRAARPTCMPTTTPGSELLSSWLQSIQPWTLWMCHLSEDQDGEAKLSPSSRRSTAVGPMVRACLDSRPATLPLDPTPRGGQGHSLAGDNVGTALAIPIATEGLELDLKEGGWLCKGRRL